MNATRIARNVSTAAVATIAAWSSWSHMVHVALRFGERPEVAYVLPISVDGMLIVASTAMVDDQRAGRDVRWSARIAFGAGVAASVAANIAAAQPTLGARIVAAWPALALLLVVEMLSRARPPSLAAGPPYRNEHEPADGDPDAVAGARAESVPVPAAPPSPSAIPEANKSVNRTTFSRRRERAETTADTVIRLRAECPDASPADIAAQAGVSERHVRRLLAVKR